MLHTYRNDANTTKETPTKVQKITLVLVLKMTPYLWLLFWIKIIISVMKVSSIH